MRMPGMAAVLAVAASAFALAPALAGCAGSAAGGDETSGRGWRHYERLGIPADKAVIDWFVNCDDLLFRCVVVNKGNLWSSDDEDGFYVAYYQLLYHWLVPGNAYHVYLDKKKNSRQRRVDTLRK